jgi:hypothetical protein
MNKKIINRVTVTGADNSIHPYSLVGISETFPFIEWGILLSQSTMGKYRFPNKYWLKNLEDVYDSLDKELLLSGHLCGKWVRDICNGEWTIFDEDSEIAELGYMFSRFQLNFHALEHKIDPDKFIKGFNHPLLLGCQFIFQFDNVNNDLMNAVLEAGIDAVPLFDTSGGAGVLPEFWPKAIGKYSGYAGGLSPDNLDEQMESIIQVAGDGPIWIDAETHLRSDNDRQFDLNKVVKFLINSEKWVI